MEKNRIILSLIIIIAAIVGTIITQELQVDGKLKVLDEIDASGNRITNVGEPILTTDAVNAGYLNTIITTEETMKRIKTGSIDLMLTDPPYNTTACEWDVAINLPELWAEWERILKPDGLWVFTTSQPFTSELILSRKGLYKCEWIWDKALGGNSMTVKYMPYKIHENIIVFGRGKTTYNPIMEKGVNRLKNGKTRNKDNAFNVNGADYKINDEYYPQSILKISNAQRTGRIHPTEKPIDLMRYLIKTYSNEGETVFDGFSGSGSCALACIEEKRNFIGSELNNEYFNKSTERIKIAQMQTKLF